MSKDQVNAFDELNTKQVLDGAPAAVAAGEELAEAESTGAVGAPADTLRAAAVGGPDKPNKPRIVGEALNELYRRLKENGLNIKKLLELDVRGPFGGSHRVGGCWDEQFRAAISWGAHQRR